MPSSLPAVVEAKPNDLAWRSFDGGWMRRLSVASSLGAAVAIPVGTLLSDRSDETLPGMAAFLVCAAVLRIFVVSHEIDPTTRGWVAATCQIALCVRIIMATVLYCGPWDPHFLAPDQAGYDSLPQLLANDWEQGTSGARLLVAEHLQDRIGYFNFVALQYSIFGHVAMVPRVFSAFAGALIVFYAFQLGHMIYGVSVAKVTALWATVFPSLILWASLNMRDIWLALSVLAILFHAVRLRQTFSLGAILVIVGHLIWMQFTRPYLVLVMTGAVVATLILARSARIVQDIGVGLLVVATLLVLHDGFGIGRDALEWLDPEKVLDYRARMAQVSVGQSGYLENVDTSSPVAVAAFLPLSVVYFLLSPFPWELTNLRRIITAPEMIAWYWLIPKALRSARRALADRTRASTAMLLTALVITLAFSVGTSNMGLAYRYRVQVIVPYLALAAAAYVHRRREARG